MLRTRRSLATSKSNRTRDPQRIESEVETSEWPRPDVCFCEAQLPCCMLHIAHKVVRSRRGCCNTVTIAKATSSGSR